MPLKLKPLGETQAPKNSRPERPTVRFTATSATFNVAACDRMGWPSTILFLPDESTNQLFGLCTNHPSGFHHKTYRRSTERTDKACDRIIINNKKLCDQIKAMYGRYKSIRFVVSSMMDEAIEGYENVHRLKLDYIDHE